MAKETTTVLNAQVKTAKINQTGAEELGIASKTLYYLVIINDKGTVRLNVGEKTYTEVTKITGGK